MEIAKCIILIIISIISILFYTAQDCSGDASRNSGDIGGAYSGGVDSAIAVEPKYETIFKYYPFMKTKEFWSRFDRLTQDRDLPPFMNYDDIDDEIPYSGERAFKMQTKIGQRKMLMCEMDFMNFVNEDREIGQRYGIDIPCVIIYAGSSPGMHLGMLLYEYPKMHVIAIDPAEMHIYIPVVEMNRRITHYSLPQYALYFSMTDFGTYKLEPDDVSNKNVDIYSAGRIHRDAKIADHLQALRENRERITQSADAILDEINKLDYRVYYFGQYMNNDLADMFTRVNHPLFFWSDIRSRSEDFEGGHFDPKWDAIILENFAMQYEWSFRISAKKSMLKFRFPWDELTLDKVNTAAFADLRKRGIDMLSHLSEVKYTVPRGHLRLQTRYGYISTEMRLIYDDPAKTELFDCRKMENRLYYFNQIARNIRHCKNPYANRILRLCNCNDCAFEVAILEKHKKIMLNTFDIPTFLFQCEYVFKRMLAKDAHAYLYEPLTRSKYLQIIHESFLKDKRRS